MPDRVFLGWERTFVSAAVDWLLEVGESLAGCLVVVPTAHSGRRLREGLAEAAATRLGRALLAPRVVTPEYLFRPPPGMEVAGRAACLAAWAQELVGCEDRWVRRLIPRVEDAERDEDWGLRMAETILPALDLLAEEAVAPGRVAEVAQLPSEEAGRWRALSVLAAGVAKRLSAWGLVDPAFAKQAAAADPALPAGVGHVVLAGVAEPVGLARRALEVLLASGGVEVTVLVAAPAGLAEGFSAWGEPDPGVWNARPCVVDEEAILVTHDDVTAAGEAVAACAGSLPEEVALGVLDASLGPEMVRAFRQAGWRVHLPDAFAPGGTGLRPFLVDLLPLLDREVGIDFLDLAACLRAPEAGIWLGEPGDRLAAAVDHLIEERKPGTQADALAAAKAWAGGVAEGDSRAERRQRDGVCVLAALEKVEAARVRMDREGAAVVLGEILDRLEAGRYDDGEDGRVVEAWREASAELDLLARAAGLSPGASVRCWLASRPAATHAGPEEESVLDGVGWLELAFAPESRLVLAGLHAGVVPDAPGDHPFLPDGLRTTLGLRDRRRRQGRDAFLLESMVRPRRRGGVLVLVCKFDGQGEPRRPSPLLLQVDDAQLPDRVRRLFPDADALEAPRRPAPSRGAWRLSPPVEGDFPGVTRVSPSLLRDYLRCPFRFFLRHVLGMAEYAGAERELDARGFGSLVHAVLEAFGRQGPVESCDGGEIREFLLAETDALLDARYGRVRSLPLQVQEASIRERLSAWAACQAAHAAAGWRIHVVEYKVEADAAETWDVGGLPAAMKIDRIDRHEDGGWMVMDYKTSKKASEPASTHLTLPRQGMPEPCGEWLAMSRGGDKGWADLQLPLYARFWRERFGDGEEVVPAYANLPLAVRETGIMTWRGYGAEVEASAWSWAEEAARRMKRGVFWPPSRWMDEEGRHDPYAHLAQGSFEEAVEVSAKAVLAGRGGGS